MGTLPRHLTEQLRVQNPEAGCTGGHGPALGSVPPGDSVVLFYPVPGIMVPLALSACPTNCTVRAFSLQGATWGQTKLLSLPGAELITCALHKGARGPLLELNFSSPLSTTQRSVMLLPPGHHRPNPTRLAACQVSSPFQEPSGPRAVLLASSTVFLVCVGQYNL